MIHQKKSLFLFCVCLILHPLTFSEQIQLSLDLELKEPHNIIFNALVDIATNSENNIYIVDKKENCVYSFNEKGEFIEKIGRPGQGPGEFKRPNSIYIDSEDNIYVLDSGNRRIEKFDSHHKYIRSVKIIEFPSGYHQKMSLDKDGNFIISGHYINQKKVLARFSPRGELLGYFDFPIVEYKGQKFNEFNQIMVNQRLTGGPICMDNEGNIFFSYTWPHLIKVTNPEGKEIFQFPDSPDLNWTPIILKGENQSIVWGEMTETRELFFLDNKFLVNSISAIEWERKTKKPVNWNDFTKDPRKYYGISRRFSLLEFYDKKGNLIGSTEIDEKIYFLSSDRKGRVLGIKQNWGEIPTILRYRIKMINEKYR